MIQPQLHIANADGKVLRIEGPARGFQIRPGIPASWGSSPNFLRPGSYPITVRLYPSGEEIPVYGPGRHFFHREFDGIEIRGARERDVFLVCLLKHEDERFDPAPYTQPINVPLQLANEVGTASPALSTDGWEILPGQLGWNFYFSGIVDGGVTAQLWQRSAGGVWTAYGSDGVIDPAADTTEFATVRGAGGRIALKASAGGLLVAVDRVMDGYR